METVQCLTSGNPVGCSIGDIEPDGQRIVSITSFFNDAPLFEVDLPNIVGVRLKAQAAGEVTLANNQAVVFHNTEIPDIIVGNIELENGVRKMNIRILRPSAVGFGLEKSSNMDGPWEPVDANSVPIEGENGFVRGRRSSGN